MLDRVAGRRPGFAEQRRPQAVVLPAPTLHATASLQSSTLHNVSNVHLKKNKGENHPTRMFVFKQNKNMLLH
jgi:hypothetical protein